MKIRYSFIILLFYLQSSIAQESTWFRTKYFNQGKKIVFDNNPYAKLPTNESEFMPLIEKEKYGITVYNRNGPSSFSLNTGRLISDNAGQTRDMHLSISSEKQAYSVEFERVYGLHRGLYDTICHITTPTVENSYYLLRVGRFERNKQIVDNRLSAQLSRVDVINASESVSHFSALKNIVIVDGKRLYLGENEIFKLKIIRGNNSTRHYVIEDNGCELIVKQDADKYTFLLSFPDGGIARFHSK